MPRVNMEAFTKHLFRSHGNLATLQLALGLSGVVLETPLEVQPVGPCWRSFGFTEVDLGRYDTALVTSSLLILVTCIM
jgi:hypothetical protein